MSEAKRSIAAVPAPFIPCTIPKASLFFNMRFVRYLSVHVVPVDVVYEIAEESEVISATGRSKDQGLSRGLRRYLWSAPNWGVSLASCVPNLFFLDA